MLEALLKLGNTAFKTLGPAATEGYGAWMAGRDEQDLYKFNADIIRDIADFDIERLDEEEISYVSSQRAAYARAGVTSSGSPMDAMLKSRTQFNLDKAIIKYNAESKANVMNYYGRLAKNKGNAALVKSLLGGTDEFVKEGGLSDIAGLFGGGK